MYSTVHDTVQGLEPEPKEPVLEPVLGENLRTGTGTGIHILQCLEPELEPEPHFNNQYFFRFFKVL